MAKIKCPTHGVEFEALEGCPECVAERREAEKTTNIVKVRFDTTDESSKGYTYYSEDRLNVGDSVMVPVRGTTAKGTVIAIDVPASEVEAFKDKVKTIPAHSVRQSEDAEVNSPENIKKRIEAVQPKVQPKEGESEPSSEIEALAEGFVAIHNALPTVEQVAAALTLEPETITTAVIKIDPGKAPLFAKHLEAAKRIVEIAASREILTEADAKAANDDLNVMAELRKAVDEERKSFTIPLNDHLSAINGAYKLITGPLQEADQITRRLLTAYKVEQQRKAAEAEKLNQDAIDLARRQAEASGTGEFTVETKPIPVPFAPKLTRTDQGKSGLVDNWKFRIVDLEKLPREYMVPDEAMLNSIAKKQHDKKQVPGVEFYNELGLRVTR